MGCDLTLLVCWPGDEAAKMNMSFQELSAGYVCIPGEGGWIETLLLLPSEPIPAGWQSSKADAPAVMKPFQDEYEFHTFGVTTKDDMGPLRWVAAGALYAAADLTETTDWRARATWAYLGALPPSTKVVLYWNC